MAEDRDLGLFMLDMVLLPGESAGLHLFEPRYRQLYADCVLGDLPFVLVRGDDVDRARVGCTARFVALHRRHEDGRLDVTVRGEDPVELMDATDGRLYRSARARVLADADEPAVGELAGSVLRRYRALAGAEATPPELTGVPLSYALAGTLRVDASVKQALLEERSERARLALLGELLEGAEHASRRAEVAAERAPTNGKVDHR